ncbi:MBL fold metallo-hydrolase [Mucisphaera calidilacus]|uniref:Ribonuclease Z n=1 Tax=Mucisphaera calidilacus TaxID=2527982 RepID=A0A518BUQ6_9BACT|nr:MBL fold metallo-hydrolase [Mucisphaera calidilacus]QDU70725.1 ribonuclease Z [Mucisphaera calidilacus]
MLPHEPQRRSQLGFLYLPPFRVQGISVAGEETVVQIPELDINFDIGLCPRAALSSNFVALSHGHMDHTAALTYYLSQRHFQGMGTGTVFCHPELEAPLKGLMEAWISVENQKTPYNLMPLEHEAEFKIKNDHYLRAFETNHTVPSMGYVILERRSKLKPEYVGLPQPKLVELKQQGVEITRMLEIPLVAYLGDTAWGEHFERPDVLQAQILITECTFLEKDDHARARVGKHLHLRNIVDLLQVAASPSVVLTHLSRRTNMNIARRAIEQTVPEQDRKRVFVLMDHRTNRRRYENQLAEAAENS